MSDTTSLGARLAEVRRRRGELETKLCAIAGAALAGDATAAARSDDLARALSESDRTERLICAAIAGGEEAEARRAAALRAAALRAAAIADASARIRELVEERNQLVETFLRQAKELGGVRQRINAIGDEFTAARRALGIRPQARWLRSFSLAGLSDRLAGMLFAYLPGEVKPNACNRPAAHFDAKKWLQQMLARVRTS